MSHKTQTAKTQTGMTQAAENQTVKPQTAKVKICGLTRPADIAAVNAARPDYIGFVFAESRRQATIQQARKLKSLLDPGILSVGVFVNPTLEETVGLAWEGVIDLVQLHGGEDEETVRRVKDATGLPVIKAVSVSSAADVIRWRDSAADFLLLDNRAGGTGQVFDWSLLPPLDRPWFLAGGLDETNIPAALALSPYCLDLSSGAETGGVKDKDKIKRIVEMIRKG